MIAIKVGNAELIEWMFSLDGLDVTKTNAKGQDALAVAKATNREHLLPGITAPSPTADETEATAAAGTGDGPAGAPLPLPPGRKASADAADTEEVVRLGHALEMLKVCAWKETGGAPG